MRASPRLVKVNCAVALPNVNVFMNATQVCSTRAKWFSLRLCFGLLRCVLGCSLVCGQAWALSLDGNIRDLRRTVWGAKEGVPASIGVLAQSSDGYIWVGNQGGVVRFDGLRFERVNIPRQGRVSSLAVSQLFAPSSGGLWVGFVVGGAAFMKDGEAKMYSQAQGLPTGGVVAMAQGADGTVWLGTTRRLARLDGPNWRLVGFDWNFPEAGVGALLADASGVLWAVADGKVLMLPKGASRFEPVAGISRVDNVLAQSPSGEIWTTVEGSPTRLRGVSSAGLSAEPLDPITTGNLLAFDRDGALWLKVERTLSRVTDPAQRASGSIQTSTITDVFGAQDGLTAPYAADAILVDREGNVWIISGNSLERFAEVNVRRVLPSRQMPSTAMNYSNTGVVAADAGDVWIFNPSDEAIWLHQGGAFQRHGQVKQVISAARASDGTVWFAALNGVWRYSAGQLTQVPMPPGTGGANVYRLTREQSGHLWLATRDSVYRYADGKLVSFGAPQDLPSTYVLSLFTDPQSRVWFGYPDGQIAMVDEERVSTFNKAQGLDIGDVTALHGRQDRVWAGGELGLAFFNGQRFRTLKPTVANAFDGITGVVETAAGDLWLNGAAGIVHASASALSRALQNQGSEVDVEVFAQADGLQGNGARIQPLPSMAEGTDGRLWISTDAGVYLIDPSRLHRNAMPPVVQVRQLTVNGKAYLPTKGMSLPPRTTGLRIEYVGLSLTLAEKVRYRYQLQGVDAEWQEAQARSEVFYTGLKPGDYNFHVQASNNDGLWNETGATLDFSIPPTFVQTGWFMALCVLFTLGLIWMLVLIRVRQVAVRVRSRLETQLAERERIARELHDTLLQSTQGLILSFQATANTMAPNQPGREMLEATLQRADEVMAEGRDRVMDLRTVRDAAVDLRQAIAEACQQLAQDHAMQWRIDTEGATQLLQRKVKDEAYRIAREALVNAFGHSQGRAVEVQIIYSHAQLQVRIRDDGIGISPALLAEGKRPGHWGIKGMQERALSVGGELSVWGRPGAGTEIELTVPAARAYVGGHQTKHRWWWFQR